jgi:hypothetical protein
MKTRPLLIAMLLLLGPASSAQAQVSFDIGFSNGNIGFNIGNYPQLALIPGSPVYYAPRLNSNFFFYDGLYWVYRDDRWFSSIWYNGPWEFVGPQYVPLFVLRVPVRYYRQPPQYFRGWRADAPPRWGQHWGRDWRENVADGTIGIVVQSRLPRPCQLISASIREMTIHEPSNSSIRFAPKITATSHVKT